MIYGNSVGGVGIERTYVLTDETGAEYPATYVGYETTFDATENDIRVGKYAATDIGIVKGTKEIPSYHTTEGIVIVTANSSCNIVTKNYDYTKLQVIVCGFNSSLSNSVSAEKVVINGAVYSTGSTEKISVVTIDSENKQIVLGITNEWSTPLILRYFTYKEEY